MRDGERAARAAAYERARTEILVHVPATARRVLDLGCATGTTGAALKQRQDAHVTGIELEPEYAQEARGRLDEVITGDVATPPPHLERFDALIAADILEHLPDPWSTLKAYTAHLEPNATVIVSLPNVGHWSVYAALARGRWPRKPEGIFDATHLRWFTRKDALELLSSAGLQPHTVVRRRWVLTRGSRLDRYAPDLNLLTFQHVIAAIYPAASCR
jgi:trans-aconitate methyltransferase